jgi:putative endonuclease
MFWKLKIGGRNSPDQDVGARGERLAASFLKKNGYKVMERNYRSKRWGEIDIVAWDGDTLVFVEVKTRMTSLFGKPQEAVHPQKIRSLKRAGQFYLRQKKVEGPVRIDVVAVTLGWDPRVKNIELFKGV